MNAQQLEEGDDIIDVNKNLSTWKLRSCGEATPPFNGEMPSIDQMQHNRLLSQESLPISLMTLTADFEQDANRMTSGCTKSIESFTLDKKEDGDGAGAGGDAQDEYNKAEEARASQEWDLEDGKDPAKSNYH